MAYLPQEEELQGGVGQQGQTNQPAQTVQQLSTGTGANLGTGGATFNSDQNIQRAQPDSPTGFTNINRYLDQNQKQGQQMADSVTSNVLDTANTAASTIRDTGDVFNKNVESQRVEYDPSKYVNNKQVSDDDIKWAVNEITTRHTPQVSDDDIKWAVNDVTTRHGGMTDAAANEIYNLARQNSVTADRLEQFVPGTQNWLQQQGKTLDGRMNDAAANETYNLANQHGVTGDRLEQFLPGSQNWLQQQGKTLIDPTRPVNNNQVSDADIKRAVNDSITRHGSGSDASANEIYNAAKQYGVTADRLEQFLPGTQNWLQQQGKTLNTPAAPAFNMAAPQVSDDDIKWAVNDISIRHGGMTEAAANEVFNLARQNGVTADRLEQFLPGTKNWLQQQGKTLNTIAAPVPTDASSLYLQSSQIVNDPARLQEFLRQRDAEYRGFGSIEEDFDSVNRIRSSLNDVRDVTDMLRSDSGRGTLASRLNPDYSTTAGMRSLDNMLFADEAKQEQIYNTLNQIENMDLHGIYDNTIASSKSIVDQIREANLATREKTSQLLGSTRDVYGNVINQNINDSISNARGVMSGIQEKLRTNQRLTPDEVNRLGISMDDYNQLQDTINHNNVLLGNLKDKANNMVEAGENTPLVEKYINAILTGNYNPDIASAFEYVDPSLYINASNAADPELYARQQALFNLANQDEGFNLIGDPAQTGSYMDQLRGTYNTASVLDSARTTRDEINTMENVLQSTKDAENIVNDGGNAFDNMFENMMSELWDDIKPSVAASSAVRHAKDAASSAVSHTKKAASSAAKKTKKAIKNVGKKLGF